jgi:alpha-beta hydrolase superfamily lysophospholipase
MDATELTISTADGEVLHVDRWSGDDAPRAIVLIAHGMGEHAGRYARFAAALVDAGHVVYAYDHRGHGRTAGTPDRHGDLGAAGWAGLVDDLGVVAALARADHPDVPLVVFGHSMGSFALQQHLLHHSAELDAAILCGTSAGDVIAAGLDPAQGADLTAFNAAFEPARTDYDWLSRDEAEVDAYIADPACGFGLVPAAMPGLIEGARSVADLERLAAIRPDLPILLVSGDADPLAGGGALIELVAERYREAGVRDVTVRLHPGARHELLNEVNRDEVTAELLTWIDGVVPAAVGG